MKLTKIDSYEIQAFAFRVMTGYMAPGKDVSPLAREVPYEERCAAWDEWRNKHAHCILAMLHGFETLIDRDDEPTGALRAENDRLLAERDACTRMLSNALKRAADVEAERDELRRQLDPMGEYASADELIAALRAEKAEDEAMKLDARRYRWLRNEANTARKCDPMVCIYPLDEQDLIDGDRLDVAIDAAMGLTRPAEEA